MFSLFVDLDLNIQPSLTAMALPLPPPSGPRRIADYLPILGPHTKFRRDCALGAVVVTMPAHPRQLLDILAIQTRFSTTCPFLIPPLPPVPIPNPGIHHRQ
jgi:hypothetical protein